MVDRDVVRNDARWVGHHLEVWAHWILARDDIGWPSESIEARAMRLAAGRTETRGAARYRGRVVVDDDGTTVPKDPPPFPKETRPGGRPRTPPLDGARLAPKVNRLLLDMRAEGKSREAWALQVWAFHAARPLPFQAAVAGYSMRTYTRLRRRGISVLARMLNGLA